MKISTISALNRNYLNTPVQTQNSKIKNTDSKNVELNNFKSYNFSRLISFSGSQKTPLTDEDYQRAKANFNDEYIKAEEKNPNYIIELNMLDLSKLNGLQKGIKVFEGLTMEEIGFILNRPTVLLNRGCNNNCAHCAFMATPYSQNTLDKMSYEDFISIVEGIEELNNRMDNKVSVCPGFGTFLDSDCMNIELTDKDGNIYDYVDCLKALSKTSIFPPLFDTSGWDPQSDKMQKRAEKFVEYVTNPENQPAVKAVNVSFNPYHILYRKSVDARHNFKFKQAKELEQKYVDRIANMLFTFTPILNDYAIKFEFLTRYTEGDSAVTRRLHDKVIRSLKTLYKKDLDGERRYVQSKEQMDSYIKIYDSVLYGTGYDDTGILPLGRAEQLFKPDEEAVKKRKDNTLSDINSDRVNKLQRGINPNGSVILMDYDVSIKTDLELNLGNKGKPVKPFAHEVEDYIYTVNFRQ